ncbi:putative NHN endonuclease [uncultured Caudovirales phage]|uniref:Putative NHN endonuclease n=1 Tax=uncultured Caudovirales phage TaxID=2100421 RepID=A0A6J5NAA1_9CAUD|nr:putative NHN endonuclease [uncultured Caudovirales phage]
MDFNEYFEYRDGHLYWKVLHGRKNTIGKKAGFLYNNGYIGVGFKRKQYKVHRIIYELHHGYCPKFIDHINGDNSDNRIENLRAATRNQNGYNTKLNINSTTGIKGVRLDKNTKKYRVSFRVNKEMKSFGSYFDKEVAKFVADAMRYKYHGNFARFN